MSKSQIQLELTCYNLCAKKLLTQKVSENYLFSAYKNLSPFPYYVNVGI